MSEENTNLFIDTSVLLSFFEFSKDDLGELEKLVDFVRYDRVRLFLPDQVYDEFVRNRDAQVERGISALTALRLKSQTFPSISRGYDEYGELRELLDRYDEIHGRLVKRVRDESAEEGLLADLVVAGLFEASERVEIDDEVFGRAKRRTELGNPPGKDGSVGDRANWEALLRAVPDGEDLCLVSLDGDFAKPGDRSSFNSFLAKEWLKKKRGEVHFYGRLAEFFAEHFPEIKLEDEIRKDELIRALDESGSFARTHAIVGELLEFPEFSRAQRNDALSAIVSNNQVYWIIEDSDVRAFTRRVLGSDPSRLDGELVVKTRHVVH